MDPFVQNSSELNSDESQRKPYNKMGFKNKVQIIAAVEKGQMKVDIAREFGIHPRTVTYIYKQKDKVIKKYTQKFSAKVDASIDLNQALMNWFETQSCNNVPVSEKQMYVKAEEIAHSLDNKKFKCTEEWMEHFQMIFNLFTYSSSMDVEPKKGFSEWSKIHKSFDGDCVYVGGCSALLHLENPQTYVSGNEEKKNYVSLLMFTNITGSHKKELVVVGKEAWPSTAKSLPLAYYQNENPKLNCILLTKLLKDWDEQLKLANKKILLTLNIHDSFLENLQLDQIKFVSLPGNTYISNAFKRIVNCFKYHFRRLQIMQSFSFRRVEANILDNIRLMSLAWHSVAPETIQSIFHPRINGCVYFKSTDGFQPDNEENPDLSLSQWCQTHSIPLHFDRAALDNFIYCDKNLESFEFNIKYGGFVPNALLDYNYEGLECGTTSSIDAFQAMKRLVRFLQSERATSSQLNSAKSLEDHLEYDVCVELQKKIMSNGLSEEGN